MPLLTPILVLAPMHLLSLLFKLWTKLILSQIAGPKKRGRGYFFSLVLAIQFHYCDAHSPNLTCTISLFLSPSLSPPPPPPLSLSLSLSPSLSLSFLSLSLSPTLSLSLQSLTLQWIPFSWKGESKTLSLSLGLAILCLSQDFTWLFKMVHIKAYFENFFFLHLNIFFFLLYATFLSPSAIIFQYSLVVDRKVRLKGV